jgi:hypothetical protein
MIDWLLNVEQLVEWELAENCEVLGKNPTQCHFFAANPTWPDLELNPGHSGGKPAITKTYNTELIQLWFI